MALLEFQFSTTNGLISKEIRLRTDSAISHIDAITKDGELLGSQLHEKDGDGVLVRKPGYDKFTKIIKVALSVPDEQLAAFWAFANAQVGKPYDLDAVIGLALHRDWRDPAKWFCSELMAAALEAAGIMKIATKLNWVDPQTLYVLLCASKYFVSSVEVPCH